MWTIITLGLLLVIAIAIFLMIKKSKKQKQKELAEEKENIHISYLEGTSIRDGNFSGLKDMPLELITKHRQMIIYDLRFLLKVYPGGLINLINLETTVDKKNYLNELVAEELNSFYFPVVETALTIYQLPEMSAENKILVITYIISSLCVEEKNGYADILNSDIRKLKGTPDEAMKNALEKILGA